MNYKRKADEVFSEYIRLRDSDKNGYGRCISCGKIVYWREKAHAGHYVNRKHLSLRYDEKNVNLQCAACNTYDESNSLGYTRKLIEKYGYSILDYLWIRSKNECKIGSVGYKAIIAEYEKKIEELKKTKNFIV